VAQEEDKDIKQEEQDLVTKLEKTWSRLKIARTAGRRDFTTYEYMLFDTLKSFRELIMDHRCRLDEIEKLVKK
jgi:hypothetical protein